MCFKFPSGGGNLSISFLKILPSARKNCICNFVRALKGRVKTPETGSIGFYPAHKHLTWSRYIARLFIGPKLPSLAGFLRLVATEYSLFSKNIFCLVLTLCCKSQQITPNPVVGKKNTNTPIVIYPNPSGQDGLLRAQACNSLNRWKSLTASYALLHHLTVWHSNI